MIAIILLIILHIWLCRQGGDHFWSESRLNISLLMLDIEHLAPVKPLYDALVVQCHKEESIADNILNAVTR